MKLKWFLLFLITVFWFCVAVPPTHSRGVGLPSPISVHAGKSFKGVGEPEYLSYDLALRDYLVKRIKQRFSVELDPKNYSGFDLLEIDALFKCKKSNESFDIFLKMFPKHP